jgi:hypothetical protein
MSSWLWIAIGATLVIDVVVFALVMRQRRRLAADLPRLAALSRLVQPQVRDHIRAHYSGHVGHLPTVLENLLPVVEGIARSNHYDLDEQTVRAVVIAAVAAERIAPRADIEQAMNQVPRRPSLDRAA